MAKTFGAKTQGTISAAEYRRRYTRRNKYHAVKTEYGGVTYDSRLEARFAALLDQYQRAGMIRSWTRQVPFRMPDGSVHRVDFMVFYEDRTFTLIEIKGRDLPQGRLKRSIVEEMYGLVVQVVFNPQRWIPEIKFGPAEN